MAEAYYTHKHSHPSGNPTNPIILDDDYNPTEYYTHYEQNYASLVLSNPDKHFDSIEISKRMILSYLDKVTKRIPQMNEHLNKMKKVDADNFYEYEGEYNVYNHPHYSLTSYVAPSESHFKQIYRELTNSATEVIACFSFDNPYRREMYEVCRKHIQHHNSGNDNEMTLYYVSDIMEEVIMQHGFSKYSYHNKKLISGSYFYSFDELNNYIKQVKNEYFIIYKVSVLLGNNLFATDTKFDQELKIAPEGYDSISRNMRNGIEYCVYQSEQIVINDIVICKNKNFVPQPNNTIVYSDRFKFWISNISKTIDCFFDKKQTHTKSVVTDIILKLVEGKISIKQFIREYLQVCNFHSIRHDSEQVIHTLLSELKYKNGEPIRILTDTDQPAQPAAQPVMHPVQPVVQSVMQPVQPVVQHGGHTVILTQEQINQIVINHLQNILQTNQPSIHQSVQHVVAQPAVQPVRPAVQPAVQPVVQPAVRPAVRPAVQPIRPAVQPIRPAVRPAVQPVRPAVRPVVQPTRPLYHDQNSQQTEQVEQSSLNLFADIALTYTFDRSADSEHNVKRSRR